MERLLYTTIGNAEVGYTCVCNNKSQLL